MEFHVFSARQTAFIDQKDATQIDMVIFAGENRGNDQVVETVLRSVRWLPEE